MITMGDLPPTGGVPQVIGLGNGSPPCEIVDAMTSEVSSAVRRTQAIQKPCVFPLKAPGAIFSEGRDLPALRGLPSVEEALARMLYLIERQRPFGLVAGPDGVGHRDLLELVRGELKATAQPVVLLKRDSLEPSNLGWALAAQLRLAPASSGDDETTWRRVEDCLAGRHLSGQTTVLLLEHLDATSAAGSPGVERLLRWAVSCGGATVVSSAQTPLRAPVQELVRRYADVRIELQPFSCEELCLYLNGAMSMADLPRFTESAVTAVFEETGGVLREVRRLGRLAVLAAEADALTVIDADVIERVASELPMRPASLLKRPELVS